MLKETIKKKLLSKVARVAYREAEKKANTVCPFWHSQKPLPKSIQLLRKF